MSNAAFSTEDESGDVAMTTWHNPTKFSQSVYLIMDASGRPRKLTWKPDERKQLPSRYDREVQTKNAAGVRIGGQAPGLVDEGKPAPLHEDIDYELQEKKAKAKAATEAAVAAHTARAIADMAERVATDPDPRPAQSSPKK